MGASGHRGRAEIVIWEDPQPLNPDPWVVGMFGVADVLSPLRSQYHEARLVREMLAEFQAEGAELWFYSANGPPAPSTRSATT